MSARTPDPIITEARARMLAAGRALAQALAQAERAALAELRQVERLLGRHPEARKRETPAWWLRGLCHGYITGEVGLTGDDLTDDARHFERKLAKYLADEADLLAGRCPAGSATDRKTA